MLMELPSSCPKSLAEVNTVPCVLCRSTVDGVDTNMRMGVMVRVSFSREGGAGEDCALRRGLLPVASAAQESPA